jgi:Heparinase II/III-like protein
MRATASHDGYGRRPHGVIHRRTVRLRHRYLAICDELLGDGAHHAEVIFQFHDALHPSFCDLANLNVGEDYFLTWSADGPIRPDLRHGAETPDSGRIAPRLGHGVPASRLVLTSPSAAPGLIVLSVLADRRVWTTPRAPGPIHSGAHSVVVQLNGEDTTEIISACAGEGLSVCCVRPTGPPYR